MTCQYDLNLIPFHDFGFSIIEFKSNSCWLWKVTLNNIRSQFWSPIGFQNKWGPCHKYSVVKRAVVKEILGWVTHWEVWSTSIYKWYQSLVTCLTGELALGWMAKAWDVAKTTNKDDRLSPTKLICYQKYLAIKIKFVSIKYYDFWDKFYFFRDKNSYFCRWNISLENTFSDKILFHQGKLWATK